MSKATVLVVEDNRDILDSVRLLLEQADFKIITAEKSLEAIEVLAQERVSVILTDLLLPEMSGLEFIRWVRGTANYDGIPIVAMSAYDETYLAAAIMAGADAALHKPEDMEKLVETINEVLGCSAEGEVGRGA